MQQYCDSRLRTVRRKSRAVRCGDLLIGGDNPVRVQSMTTSLTQDVAASVEQCIRLAEAGCEIVRLTAPNKHAAQALKEIRRQFAEAGFGDIPLVADIHFLPSAAMEAVEHVEKVRVNPGNYADKKKFQVKEYSDNEYEEELERLHEAFTPLVKRCIELGRCMRIGTNHGSLSDRIMNRYGDTPLGMVESALEFIRIAESHGFRDIVLSMKASNPKVMIEAYRLAVAKMAEEDMHYPLHLGVTEAGDGEDARIKSAIGIGALLYDGLGDTVRVSLTEDPWFELPVCRDIVRRAEKLWALSETLPAADFREELNFYEYKKREVAEIVLSPKCKVANLEPPSVIIPVKHPLTETEAILRDMDIARARQRDATIEGLLLRVEKETDLVFIENLRGQVESRAQYLVVELDDGISPEAVTATDWPDVPLLFVHTFGADAQPQAVEEAVAFGAGLNALHVIDAAPEILHKLAPTLKGAQAQLIITCTTVSPEAHPAGTYRQLAQVLSEHDIKSPVWIRITQAMSVLEEPGFGQALIEGAMFAGTHFVDGYGDFISVETVETFEQSLSLAYNILQGARMRTVKTEYVACPSCGRTLFNLQEVTQRIKGRTGHLKGVTIAVMGCIVNGPGEMADADFGYVGGAPGKVNLYVGKQCVKFNIPEADALDRLVDLIKEHDKWNEPEVVEVGV